MSLLILMRHAKAVREHEAPSDRLRGLTEGGRRDAAAAVVAMGDAGFAPLSIFASPASRTRATAHIVRDGLASISSLALIESLYLGSPETIWGEVRASFTEGGMILVGHNPGLHALAAGWIEQSRDRSALGRALAEGLATSGWAAFEVENAPLASAAAKLLGGSASRRGG